MAGRVARLSPVGTARTPGSRSIGSAHRPLGWHPRAMAGTRGPLCAEVIGVMLAP